MNTQQVSIGNSPNGTFELQIGHFLPIGMGNVTGGEIVASNAGNFRFFTDSSKSPIFFPSLSFSMLNYNVILRRICSYLERRK